MEFARLVAKALGVKGKFFEIGNCLRARRSEKTEHDTADMFPANGHVEEHFVSHLRSDLRVGDGRTGDHGHQGNKRGEAL